MIEIGDEYMIATIDGQVVATARWSWYAAADGHGAWIASTHPMRLLSFDKAVSAMTLASLLGGGRSGRGPAGDRAARGDEVVMDRLIKVTTALAVLMVASVAAIISYYAYELVSTHGETGFTARLLPFTVDGLIWAGSMFSGGRQPVARRCTTRSAESFCNTSQWVWC